MRLVNESIAALQLATSDIDHIRCCSARRHRKLTLSLPVDLATNVFPQLVDAERLRQKLDTKILRLI